MKALIPAAGQGTRLYPQTHTKPKAMVRLAGRPILGHILESLTACDVDEVIIVVGGPMREQITTYARNSYGDHFHLTFAEQQTALGLGHGVYQARAAVDGAPLLIALGDMIFESGYGLFIDAHRELGDVDGSVGVKTVDEPQHYGVAEIAEDRRIESLVEKPDDPKSNYAISGVYVIENSTALFDALDHLVENEIRGAGDEYQLTDALQVMIDRGCELATFEVEDWYDCGRPETLLEANRVLLSKLETNSSDGVDTSVVIPPVDVGENVRTESSIVGPNVSFDEGAEITDSIVKNSIVGRDASLRGVNLEASIVGDNATVEGEANHLNVGDNSSINL